MGVRERLDGRQLGFMALVASAMLSTVILLLVMSNLASEVEGATTDDAFHIFGDANFTSGNGVTSGNGTSGNPYHIEGWEMTCSTTDSIKLVNTRAHVVIQDILFNNTTSHGNRIFLENVTNVTISNVTCNQGGTALEIRNSCDVTVRNLTAMRGGSGHVYWSNRIDLFDVDISVMSGRFYLVSSNDTRFINCHTATFQQAGFRLQSGRRVSVINCTTEGNQIGVSLGSMYDCVVRGCTFSNSTSGSAVVRGRNNTLTHNRFDGPGLLIELNGGHYLDRTNTVNGVPLQFYLNESGMTISSNLTQIFLVGCDNFTVEDVAFFGEHRPVECYDIRDCTFRNVSATDAYTVISASMVSRTSFQDIRGVRVRAGISLGDADNCTIDDVRFLADYVDSPYEPGTIIGMRDSDNITLRNATVTGTFCMGVQVRNDDERPYRVDCSDVTVIGGNISGPLDYGFRLTGPSTVSIIDCHIRDFEYDGISAIGLRMLSVRNITIINTSGDAAMDLRSCRRIELVGNSIDIARWGIRISEADQVTINDNIISNIDQTAINAGTMKNASTVSGNVIFASLGGIAVYGNVSANDNIVVTRSMGMQVHCDDNTVMGNRVYDCWTGIDIFGVRVTVANNQVNNTTRKGIDVTGSYHKVFNNTVRFGKVGISIDHCTGCAFYGNNVTDHTEWAFLSTSGENNTVNLNYIVRNSWDPDTGQYLRVQAYSDGGTDYDTGFSGNFWGDYTLRYPNANVTKGFWDVPYTTSGGTVQDDFPLASFVPDRSAPTATLAGSTTITVDEGTTVTFNGTLSKDDVGITGWFWTFPYGDQGENLSGPLVQFTFDIPGHYVVTFTVFDVWGNHDSMTISLDVTDLTPPVAVAGDDITAPLGWVFTLDASNSSDNSGIISVTWTVDPGGLDITSHELVMELVINVSGMYLAVLNVSDPAGHWDTDSLWISVVDIDPPTADAGADVVVDQGQKVQFDGSGSHDNVDVIDWTWTFLDGGLVTLHGMRPAYTFDNAGAFVVTLNVTDAAGHWHTDDMNVTVRDTTPPVADAGPDQSIDEGSVLVLSGVASADNVGIASYQWFFEYDGSDVVLDGVEVQYRFDVVGEYTIILKVTDVSGLWGTDHVTVTVLDRTPPMLSVLHPVGGELTRNVTCIVSGSTEPFTRVRIQVESAAGSKEYTLTSMEDGSFEMAVGLFEGVQNVVVTATDASGNPSKVMIAVILDTVPPGLTITSPGEVFVVTREPVITIVGSVDDPRATVFVDSMHLEHTGIFSVEVRLDEGENIIEVKASDQAGNEAIVVLTVVLDTTPPALTVTTPGESLMTNNPTVRFEGTVEGATGVVLIHDAIEFPVTITSGSWEDGQWGYDLELGPSDIDQDVVVRAYDLAGNEIIVSIHVVLDVVPPSLYVDASVDLTNRTGFTVSGTTDESIESVRVNAVVGPVEGGVFEISVELEEGVNTLMVIVEDEAGNLARETLVVTLDTVKPKYDLDYPEETESKKVTISGTCDDDVVRIWVNSDAFGVVNGTFEVIVELERVGENPFTLTFEDRAGNTATETITIMRTKGEESPGFGVALAVLAIAAVTVVGPRRRK